MERATWSGEGLALTPEQQRIVSFPREGRMRLAVRGLPGAGKTTALCARLGAMLREGRRPYEILVLLPQRAQAERFEQALAGLPGPTRGGAEIVTYYSLARRAVDLFWPLLAERAGFGHPHQEPIFLTLETAQYYMWRVVEPLIREQGYFSDVAISRARLLSQLLDNLNKSALVGFDHTDIYARLKGAWTGSNEHLSRFWQAQDCASRFRALCLERNLLDFSLTTEVYCRYLLPHEVYRRYMQSRYRHLLVDNVEENVPVAHDLLSWLLEWCQSSVLVLDERGGHRVFLGADAAGGQALLERCDERIVCQRLFQSNVDLLAFADAVSAAAQAPGPAVAPDAQPRRAQVVVGSGEARFWIAMMRWVAEEVAKLVGTGVAPGQIALLAPYVSEVMRFAIQEELAQRGIGLQLLRPATQLRDDPVIRGLLVLLWLAHPDWELEMRGQRYRLPREDVALTLEVCLASLDPVRARYLASLALGDDRRLRALSGEQAGIEGADLARLWERVGFQVRERYETLRQWLETYQQGAPTRPHILLSRLFGDLLSHPGYGFYQNPEAARAYGRLVESLSKFTDAVATESGEETRVAREYVQLMLAGVASAEYLLDWPRPPHPEAVLLAPAYAYITRDVRSAYQFWLDLGSDGWWNRPNQPLTNPHVLSRHWPPGRPWRDIEEEASRREALGRLLIGLAARCQTGIYLAFSELGLDGSEQRGRLQMAVVSVLARMMRHV